MWERNLSLMQKAQLKHQLNLVCSYIEQAIKKLPEGFHPRWFTVKEKARAYIPLREPALMR